MVHARLEGLVSNFSRTLSWPLCEAKNVELAGIDVRLVVSRSLQRFTSWIVLTESSSLQSCLFATRDRFSAVCMSPIGYFI